MKRKSVDGVHLGSKLVMVSVVTLLSTLATVPNISDVSEETMSAPGPDVYGAITYQSGNAQPLYVFGEGVLLGQVVEAELSGNLYEAIEPGCSCWWAGKPTREFHAYSIGRETIVEGLRYRIWIQGTASGRHPGINAYVEVANPQWRITTVESKLTGGTMTVTNTDTRLDVVYSDPSAECSYCACKDGGFVGVKFILEKSGKPLTVDAGPDVTILEGESVSLSVETATDKWVKDEILVLTGSGNMYSYNPRVDMWKERSPIPAGHHGDIGMMVHNGNVYVASGPGLGLPSDRWLFEYHTLSDVWISRSPNPEERSISSLATYDSKLLAIGGIEPGNPPTEVPRVDVYDTLTDNWISGGFPSMPFGLDKLYSNTPSLADHLYVAGGSREGSPVNDILHIDLFCGPAQDAAGKQAWVSIPQMPTARHSMGSTVLSDTLIVVGGDSSPSVGEYRSANELYQKRHWTVGAPIDPSRSRMSLIGYRGLIYATGGVGPYGPMDEHIAYDKSTKIWRRLSALPIADTADGLLISTVSEGEIVSYVWDLNDHLDSDGDGNSTNDPDASGQTITHTYGDNGEFRLWVTVKDDRGQVARDSVRVEVRNVNPRLEEDVSAVLSVNTILRIAGEKWHDVEIYIYEDDEEIDYAEVIRYPGSPDDQTATTGNVICDVTTTITAKVLYTPDDDPINGQINGANPAWVILTFEDGSETRLKHTFNVKHPETWEWNIVVNPYVVGHEISFEATATDPGSDDLTFTWDWGDGTLDNETTYYNDGIGPDPYPSPGGTYPFSATDMVEHMYGDTDLYTVTLTVTDDDGGVAVATVRINIP